MTELETITAERARTAELLEAALSREIELRTAVEQGNAALAVLRKYSVEWEPVSLLDVIFDGGERAAKFLTSFKRDRDAVLKNEQVVVAPGDRA